MPIPPSCTWRDAAFPISVCCMPSAWALIVTADGALIFGVMGARPANAGRVYPPGGSLEPRDVLPMAACGCRQGLNRP